MNRKSKEEILDDEISDNLDEVLKNQERWKEWILEAMQEYADKEMESFADWIGKNRFRLYDTGWQSVYPQIPGVFTTQQLIQKYKDENRTNI